MHASTRRLRLASAALAMLAGVALAACGSAATPAIPFFGTATPRTPGPLASIVAGASTQPASAVPSAVGATPAPAPTPTPAPTPEPTPEPSETATSEPTPIPTAAPLPTATPLPTAPPPVQLGATVDTSWAEDSTWVATKATGTGRFQASITNPDSNPRYPACRVTVSAGHPNRSRTFAWASKSAIPGFGSAQVEFQLAKVPVTIGSDGYAQFTSEGITCTGSVTVPRGAVGAPRPTLRSAIVKSSATQPVGGRSTITFVINVTNITDATVRAACRVQVAGTHRTEPPLATGEKLAVYTFLSPKNIASGATAKLSFKGTRAPTKSVGSRFYWLWGVHCWAR
jgi:hypothetical protein